MTSKNIVFLCLFLLFSLPVFSQNKPRIMVIATGGGISGTIDIPGDTSFTVGNLTIAAILDQLPEHKEVCEVETFQLANIASQSMTKSLWKKLAYKVNEAVKRDDIDGVVITHGTDTMEETGYFLNLVIPTSKPIILTGASKPFGDVDSDGRGNLFNALLFASHPSAKARGVTIVFSGRIFDARNVLKRQTYSISPFIGTDIGLMGYIHGNRVYIYSTSTKKHTYQSEFSVKDIKNLPKVEIIYGYVDQELSILQKLEESLVQGIVVAGVGNGNLSNNLIKVLDDLVSRGITVVRSSRAGNGLVTKATEINDLDHGFISGDNLSAQKARVLLMMALTKTKDRAKIQDIFDNY